MADFLSRSPAIFLAGGAQSGFRPGEPLLLGLIAADPSLAGTSAAERQLLLAAVVANVDERLQRQSERDAEKQATSKQIRQLIGQGRELARDMKLALRGKLGARAVELVKYRLKSLGETRQAKKVEPVIASRAAASSGPPPEVTPVAPLP